MPVRNTVRLEGDALSIRLDGERDFHQLCLSVDDAESACRLIREAVGIGAEASSPEEDRA